MKSNNFAEGDSGRMSKYREKRVERGTEGEMNLKKLQS